MVLPTPIQLQENRKDTVINPCFIAEVLSKSTQDYDRAAPLLRRDRSHKFLAYKTINSFQEYLLIDQYRVYVEHYLKTASNQWLLSEYTDSNVTLKLETINIEVKINELYENVDF
ncbi:MAG: Uma2 family endonuclease [Xenococcaceae cyanobacterium MO_188.B19]|nr:Uma2 family endonuclease [Xenococcaceae cyanobacterium MO_188.B19]